MVEKVTRMLIKVDLQCCRCYKKIKKILCEFPQIQDQIYDEKRNAVLIVVVCCSPEKIRQKIICKGGETVQGVEILLDKPKEPEKKPEKPKEPEKKPEKPKDPEKEPEKKPEKPKEPEKKPNPVAGFPLVPAFPMVPVYPMVPVCCCPPFYGGYGRGPCYCGRRRPRMCYDGCGRPADECQGGHRGSCAGLGRSVMCDDGCGRPASECQGGHRGSYPGLERPVLCDDGCGRLACECQGGNRGYYVSRCDNFSEENANACTVM
ncbi:protein PYRICULARIA ORYZAE RESISTANCE 21-like [Rhodamnia argentea]|uniref:Protein PYRICULARIA ORYZAE RESISTANCE 21-like n=1 Tax=Rhodamnia argentea TaxID=178133 RepID=A0ABM3H6S3_9MYRT|nr:protein PYRICULARIA ORYZAE RESISTANCE 21-like [Rhodamnia argentea]